MSISFDTFNKEYKCHLKGAITHTVSLGSDPSGNISRIDNAFEKIPVTFNAAEAKLETLYSQVENAKAELTKPFTQEAELAEKSARLAELDSLLSLDGKDEPASDSREDSAQTQQQPAPQTVTPKESFTAVMVKAETKKEEINTTSKPPQEKIKKKSHFEL